MQKTCTVCNESKPLDDFPITSKKRGGRRTRCKPCHRAINAKWRAGNPEKQKISEKRWRDNNVDKSREKVRCWRDANRARFNENAKRYQQENAERCRELVARWRRKNPAKVNAQGMRRYAGKLKAVPSWVELATLSRIYEEARQLSQDTGIQHHVDHIVPLQSKFVCGLHCQANLQIITAEENRRKNNRWWPDMP